MDPVSAKQQSTPDGEAALGLAAPVALVPLQFAYSRRSANGETAPSAPSAPDYCCSWITAETPRRFRYEYEYDTLQR